MLPVRVYVDDPSVVSSIVVSRLVVVIVVVMVVVVKSLSQSSELVEDVLVVVDGQGTSEEIIGVVVMSIQSSLVPVETVVLV